MGRVETWVANLWEPSGSVSDGNPPTESVICPHSGLVGARLKWKSGLANPPLWQDPKTFAEESAETLIYRVVGIECESRTPPAT